MIIKQLRIGPWDVFSYIIGDEASGLGMVIDPGGMPEIILAEAKKANLKITTIINTHGHNDHCAANRDIQQKTGAKIVMHELDAAGKHDVDVRLTKETCLELGRLRLQIFHTPGHTPGGICIYADGQLFTGDTLFVKDSGRTDLPGGDRPTLGASLRRLMRLLPDETIVWPGHDYGPMPHSTLGWEKRNNINAKEYGYYTESKEGASTN